jgi:putative tricarboxylic transport membrane protein
MGASLFICFGSIRLSLGSFHSPGPGLLSFFAGVILGILALILHLQSRRVKTVRQEISPPSIERQGSLRAGIVVLALLAYSVGMQYLGFLPATAVFLGLLLRLIEPQRWSVVIGGALAASAASYGVFELWLQAGLPKGLLYFF